VNWQILSEDDIYENTNFCLSNRWNLTFSVFLLAGLSIITWCFLPVTTMSDPMNNTGNACYDSGYGGWVAVGLTLTIAVLYWIESFCCSASFQYLTGVKDEEGLQDHIRKIKSVPPNIFFTIECYHYETHTYTTTDSNGNTSVNTSTQRVVTYRETQPFRYRVWDDLSGELIGVGALYRVTKIRFGKSYVFAEQHTQQCWEAAKNDIQNRNRHRDSHMDFFHGFSLAGYRGRKLSLTDPDYPPTCLSLAWYCVCSVFFVGYCFRSWFHSISTKQRFMYKKRVQC